MQNVLNACRRCTSGSAANQVDTTDSFTLRRQMKHLPLARVEIHRLHLVNTLSSPARVTKRWPNYHAAATKWIRVILLSLLFRYSNCLAAIHDFPKGTSVAPVMDVVPQSVSVVQNVTNRFIKNVSISYSYTPKNKTNARIDFAMGLTNGSISGVRVQPTVASDKVTGRRKSKQQEISLENMDKQENQLSSSDDSQSTSNGDISVLEEMSFGTANYTTVTTQIGSTSTMLTCTVHNIGEGVVSFTILYQAFQNFAASLFTPHDPHKYRE
ncbi:hypothetical protein DMENIID0001_143240 [Sergentomyia squamirostris]